MVDLLSARFFGKSVLLQGYWQMPLAEEAREIFTITTPLGLFTPTRVPQGVLNATAYFQGVMTELLVGIKCKTWVDDVFFYADTDDELLDTLDEILARLESVGCLRLLTSVPFSPVRSCGCLLYTSPSPRDS